jgi:Ribosomal L28e protein family
MNHISEKTKMTTCPLPETEYSSQRPCKEIFPLNLTNVNFTLPDLQNKPAESTGRITFKSGQKRTLKKIKNVIKSQKYRPDLQQAALRRASAIYRSQKTKPVKKSKAAAKKTEA